MRQEKNTTPVAFSMTQKEQESPLTTNTKGLGLLRPMFLILCFFAFIALCFIVKIAASVVIPIVAAVLLSFVLEPLVKKMNRLTHISWSIISFFLLVIILILMIVLGRLIVSSLLSIASNYQNYEKQITWIYKQITGHLNIPFDEERSVFSNMWGQFGGRKLAQSFALSMSGNLFFFVKKVLTILLFTFFLLSEMKFFRRKLHFACDSKTRTRVTTVVVNTMHQVTRYISIKSLISLVTGLFVFLGTYLLGLDFPIVWGFLAFLLNFIPTFGSLVSIVITILFSVIQFYPSPLPIFLTTVLMIGVNGTLGQFVEPHITGENLGLSPFIILSSLTVWGWLWGFVGMILSVPMMVIVKIVCENISILKPIAVMLGTGYIPQSKLHKTKRQHI